LLQIRSVFGAREKDAFVLKLEHRTRVLAVRSHGGQVLQVEGEADVVDDVANDVIRRLDARLARNVGEVVQQRAEVDPLAA